METNRTLLVAALVRPVALASCHAADRPVQVRGLVDLHCHAAGIGAGGSGCFVSPAMRRSYKFGAYLRAFGVTRDEIEKLGDRVVIDRLARQLGASKTTSKAVVLALDGVVDGDGNVARDRTEMYVPNEFVAAQVARHANLLFGASVNPYRSDALARLQWAKERGAVLVKWLPAIQHIDPADPKLIPFYRTLVALQLPLLTHTGTEHAFSDAEDRFCDPERLRLPLSLDVTVIAAHAATTGRYAGEAALARLARLMREYPNLYADISSLTQLNKLGHLERVVNDPCFQGRLVFGTDYPLISMRSLVSPWYHVFRLGWSRTRQINAITNPWDRDVALKQSLGVPADVWTRGAELLGLGAST